MTADLSRKLHLLLHSERQFLFHGNVSLNDCYDENIPDYCDDPRLVIEAMREYCGGDEYKFSQFLFSLPIHGTYPHLLRGFIDLILDKTGKLALLAIEWLEGRS